MKKLLLTIILLMSGMSSFAQTVSTDSIRSKFPYAPNKGFLISYAYYLPIGYNPNDASKKWPLYVVLHGNGEKVWNYNLADGAKQLPLSKDPSQNKGDLTKSWMIGSVIAAKIDPKGIIIQPRSPFGGWDYPTTNGSNSVRMDGAVVNDLLNKVIPKFNIDTNAMYLTGGSEGGASVSFYACSIKPENDRFAAYLSAAGWPPDENTKFAEVARKLNNGRGVAFVHNTGDGVVRYDGNPPFVNAINALKPKELAIGCWTPGTSHDSWNPVYRNGSLCFSNVYTWFLIHRKSETLDTVMHDTIVAIPPPVQSNAFICDSLQATVHYMSRSYVNGYHHVCTVTNNFKVDSVRYDWKANPVMGSRKDSVYMNIYGRFKVLKSGTYTFRLNTDDGSNLWINSNKVISDWTNHGVRERSATVNLTAGVWNSIVIDYYEATYDASLKCEVEGPDLKKQVIKRKY